MKAGFIGCGNMGGALAAVAAGSLGGASVLTADHNPGKLEALRFRCGTVVSDAPEIARTCDYIFLGVKPQVMKKAADEIRAVLEAREDRYILVSMAAGLTLRDAAALAGGAPVIRIMPNTPCAVGAGVILYDTLDVTPEEEAAFASMMAPAGTLMRLEEGKIDAASAISGCGPAFVCLFVEALTDGGVRCGLPRAKAEKLALETLLGTAKLALDTGKDPAVLRGEVCSPAGSTIEGVAALEKAGVRYAVLDAVTAAFRRTAELGK